MMRKYGARRHMAGETAASLVGRRIGLQPNTQHGSKDRRLQRRTMQQRRIDPAEGLEVRRLLARPLPFLIVPVVTLLTVFRSDEDLFNIRNPIGLNFSLLRSRRAMRQVETANNECDREACGNSLSVPFAS